MTFTRMFASSGSMTSIDKGVEASGTCREPAQADFIGIQ